MKATMFISDNAKLSNKKQLVYLWADSGLDSESSKKIQSIAERLQVLVSLYLLPDSAIPVHVFVCEKPFPQNVQPFDVLVSETSIQYLKEYDENHAKFVFAISTLVYGFWLLNTL